MSTVSVLGGGSFGTVIANIIAENGYLVNFWMRSEVLVEEVNQIHENPQYLPGYRLHENVVAYHDMQKAVANAEVIFVAVPSAYFRTVVKDMLQWSRPDAMLVSTTKGIEAGTFNMMSQVLHQEAPGARIGVLSGPNLAKEIAAKNLTGTVIASQHTSVREMVQKVLKSEYFRVYTNDDMFGVELGGALKNIYAIIAGLASAMGMGHNTNSMLVTRSLTEMARFGRRIGADPMTFLGLSGVGDLVVTCSSPLSRNFRIGLALGQGKNIEEAVAEVGQVAEGVNTLKQVKEKADELGVYMPLVNGLYQIVYNGSSVKQIVASLMLGEQALDVEYEANQTKTLNTKE
ncbi:MAG: NAD(P)H-dependent glycerol-3-phosphate dehydrogenase [Gammaproteobacteria bacterium]|nr:NAD(P)H-dependent glycerol-3-phosphate dehydrogenase [Gammaproteobacteria bacterium]MDP2139235.1 NAD(P)H-dependent glycerol-3-phosphate dehydrogenase [Gammaproteobacteria bacterium]MDP2348996.1 NAD(P)H-dependent glycerol-3-phosphate dehydrogenase [Gammaproteobacteria bacterium]